MTLVEAELEVEAVPAGCRSVEQVARSIRRPVEETVRLLCELEQAGWAVRVGGGWRASERAVREFGEALGEVEGEPSSLPAAVIERIAERRDEGSADFN